MSVGSNGESVHTDEVYDFLQLALVLKQSHQSAAKLHKVGCGVLCEPLRKLVGVERVGGQPVDGREVTLVGKRRVKTPEYLYDTQGRLRNRLRDIAAGRRYRADNRERAFGVLCAVDENASCSLVELRKTAAEVSRIAFLAGHFLETA